MKDFFVLVANKICFISATSTSLLNFRIFNKVVSTIKSCICHQFFYAQTFCRCCNIRFKDKISKISNVKRCTCQIIKMYFFFISSRALEESKRYANIGHHAIFYVRFERQTTTNRSILSISKVIYYIEQPLLLGIYLQHLFFRRIVDTI